MEKKTHLRRGRVRGDPEDSVALVGKLGVVVVEADGLDGAAAYMEEKRRGQEKREG